MKPSAAGQVFFFSACIALFVFSINRLGVVPRSGAPDSLAVALPRPLQVFMAGGDRYLASNLATSRAVLIGAERLDPTAARVLGKIQEDAAWFNAAQEDNYYTAAAVLPWVGQLPSAQEVLQRAVQARPFDLYPSFYLGFNKQYFQGDYLGAAAALQVAAQRAPSLGIKNALLDMAAKWAEREENKTLAKLTIKSLADKSTDPGLKKYLDARVLRIERVQELRNAAAEFRKKVGRPLKSLDELLEYGILKSIPEDPLKQGGYAVVNGTVIPKIQGGQ